MVSLILQFSFYYFLNYKVEQVMAPTDNNGPVIVESLKAEIQGTNLENLKISYAKDYLAYMENGVLKVFNLKQEKVVFQKKPETNSDKNMGVLYYQWLPDRNTLVYFYSRKNPNPVSYVEVPIPPEEQQEAPNHNNTQTPDNTEDPNQNKTGNNGSTADSKTDTKSTTAAKQTRTEVRYNNPQITELFTLELPPSEEEGTEPDDRLNRSIDSFPAGASINQMVVSTFTNLLYLTIQTGSSHQLMEIDIMKNVRTLNQSGEIITQMAASDKFGTLYIKSKVGKSEQIYALQGWDRTSLSKDADDVILGNRAGILYLGKVQNGQLVNVRSAADTNKEKMAFETVWEGSIPYQDNKEVIIGSKNEIIIYDNQAAYIISNGKETKIDLDGEENYISSDGVQLIQVTRVGTSTQVELKPLEQ